MQAPDQLRLAYLDSLRFAAALLVLVQHLYETQPGSAVMPFIRLGPGVAGVALFFFISGFVIPLSAKEPFDWRAFMLRRVFRIYPLFLSAIAFLFILGAAQILPRWADMLHATPMRWLANLALIQEFVGAKPFLGVSWTLAIELIWYAMFAMSLILFRARAAQWLDRLIPAVLVALMLASLVHGQRIPLGRPIMIYAAVVGYNCWRYLSVQTTARALLVSVLRFIAVAGFASYVAFGYFRHPTITFAQDLGPWAMAMLVFLTVVLLRPLREARWLNHGPIPKLGAVSYSIYLLHPIAINAATLYVSAAWRAPAAIVGTLALALASYRLIEQPGVDLGRRLARSWFPRRTTASEAPRGVLAVPD